MKKMILILACTLSSAMAIADTIRELNVFQNQFVLDSDIKDLKIERIRIVNVPSAMKDLDVCIPSSMPESDLETCSVVAEKTKVAQVVLSYTQGNMEDNSYDITVNFPIEKLSAEQISKIEATTKGFFDFMGKKSSLNRKLANEYVQLQTTRFQSPGSYKTCQYETCNESDYYEVHYIGSYQKLTVHLK